MQDIKRQLYQKYPFLSNLGTIHQAFDLSHVLQKYRNEKLLVLMVGVQGAGKTAYLSKNLSEHPTINLDEVLNEVLLKHRKQPIPSHMIHQEVSDTFFNRIRESLQRQCIAVVDSGAIDFSFRTMVLANLRGEYTKVIILVLNPPLKTIITQISGDIAKRERPGLWEDVRREWDFLQYQIREHYIEMGVDDVYML